MVIIFNSYGDHSNRLFQNIRYYVYCIENNIEFKNATFNDLAPYYNDSNNSEATFLTRILKNRIIKIIFKTFNLVNIISFKNGMSDISILSNARNSDYYIEGWDTNDTLLTIKYQDLMIKKYSLNENYYKDNLLYLKILSLDKSKDNIIGVHIRRGDYKTYKNGIYYFEDEFYSKFMDEIKKQITEYENKKCIFIIFSNEETTFKESNDIWISKNTWYIDHFLMTKCDYLIGPPSSFTKWASYIGKTKYLHLKSSDQKIQISDFEYCLN